MNTRHAQPILEPPQTPKAIPYGQYLAIDQEFYEPKPPALMKDRHLKPHGSNVNLKSDFIPQPSPISLATGSLKVNYGSYIYQQKTGYDSAHPADVKTAPVEIMFR